MGYLGNGVQVFVLSMAVLMFNGGRSQGETPTTFQELIERMAIEREKLVQFSVDCILTGNLELLGFTNTGVREQAVVKIEYCRPEQHYLVNVTKKNVTSFGGTTGKLAISGESNKRLVVTPKSANLRLRPHQTPLVYFDPRGTGITSFGDTKRNSSFESVISSYLSWETDVKKEVKLTSDGFLHFEHSDSDLKLIVDSRDYWPTYYSFDAAKPQKWDVELKEVHGMRMPHVATLQYDGRSLNVEYVWNQVNQQVIGGDAAAQRIAALFHVAIERPVQPK